MTNLKESGVKWLGKIPSDWKLIKGKYVYKIDCGKKDAGEGSEDGKYPFFTCSMTPKRIDTFSFDTEALLVAGNGIVGFTQYYKGKFDAYQRTYVLDDFSKEIDVEYLKLYVSNNLTDSVKLKSVGSVIEFIKLEDLKQFEIAYPSLEKQKRISEFLKGKCEKIDNLIEIQKKAIEKLKKYKDNFIVETINKGLYNHEKFVESEIAWLNDYPKEWKVVYLGSIVKERKKKNNNMVETNLLSLSYGNVIRKNINTNEGLLPESFEGYNIIEKGDIVLRLTDLQNDHTSLRTGLCKERGIITSAYVTLQLTSSYILPEFLRYYLHSFDICKGFYGMGAGIRQGLNFDGIKKIQVLIPSIEEQGKIVKLLDEKSFNIDRLIEIKKQKMAKLQEYKKSLVYEYITGKKEI